MICLKALLIIGDGMADRPLKELGWRTPLEAANKPSMNHVASVGICGIIDPIAPGIPPGSDTATLALLGYDALKVYSGRGAFEALGWGIEVAQGDVCFRCNFATVNEEMTILDRRAGRIASEDASKLAESLRRVKLSKPGVDFIFANTVEHRAVLVLRGSRLSPAVSDSDPAIEGKEILKVKPLDDSAEARFTAELLNELAQKFHEVLKAHPLNKERKTHGKPPANFILFRGAGTLPKIKPLSELYMLKASCVAATALIRGVCRAAGMQLLNVKGATGNVHTDYIAKAKAAVKALENSDLVLLHVKAPDAASHDGNIKQKVEVIEKIDKMLAYILNKIDLSETYVALTADHTSSCITRNHEGDPVPIAIMGPYIRSDDVDEFSERACARGGLGRLRGKNLMPILMNYLGKVKKFGA
ncbi:MAG: 2,3-bisphosphoglycerate-independent phosphoglycerate mutase [Candidatus Bathyarchaeia archaeon]